MSVASRLSSILRSQVTAVLRGRRAWRGRRGFKTAWTERTAGESDATASDTPRSGPPRDPVLAGYYANLELPYGADLAAVEAARKRLLRRYHPDLHGSDLERQRVATELSKRLSEAYDHLRRHLEATAARP